MYIGQISELSGYSQRMIRYLEDQGLVAPDRSDSNLRRFSDQDLTRILKIKKLKELGFTYPEIKELIDKDEHVLSHKGSDLLKRHHAEAQELLEKIQQLEMICYGQPKTKLLPEKATTLSTPPRTAYRIRKLELVAEHLQTQLAGAVSDVTIWKFIEFLRMEFLPSEQKIDVFEIFRGSSQMVVLSGLETLPTYEKAWQETALPFHSNSLGSFPVSELSEFFGNYEIILEQKIFNADNQLLFHALLPYQAIYIASGESLT